SLKELLRALSSVKNQSAPGLDQIHYAIINNFPREYLIYLLEMYNKILKKGVFPESWKNSLIVLIPKPSSKVVRSISLMPCLCKLMERML
ncbi:RNA-directed DNA polymerase from mobile element jockey, partial [Trachymyrmex septentrionalis]